MPANLSPTASAYMYNADGSGGGQIYNGPLNGVMGSVYNATGAKTPYEAAQSNQRQQQQTWQQVMNMLGGGSGGGAGNPYGGHFGFQSAGGTPMSSYGQAYGSGGTSSAPIVPGGNTSGFSWQNNKYRADMPGRTGGMLTPNGEWATGMTGGTRVGGSSANPSLGTGTGGYMGANGGTVGGGGYPGGQYGGGTGQATGSVGGGFAVNQGLHGDFTNSLQGLLKNPGLSQKTIEGMINKGTDEIAESENSAALDLTERAAASGGIEGGGMQKGMRELRSGYAGQRGDLARTVRTDAEKDRLNRIEAGLGIAGSYLGRVEDRQASEARYQAENAREDRNKMIGMLMSGAGGGGSGGGGAGGGGDAGSSFAFSQFGGGALNSGQMFGGGGLKPSNAYGQGYMTGQGQGGVPSEFGTVSGFGSSGAGNAQPYNSLNAPQYGSFKPGEATSYQIPNSGYSSTGSSAWLRR